MQRSRGFSLVELLVVIAIIGILVAILLPAVQAARAAARRTGCTNNLHQIGVAMANYHDTLRSYPLSMTSGGGATPGGGTRSGHFSWLAQLLPFVEEGPLFRSIDFNITMADQPDEPLDGLIGADHPNAAAAATQVSVYLCPSDGAIDDNTVMGTANPAGDNYAANAGWPSYATGFEGERPYPGKYNGFIPIASMRPGSPVPWHPHGPVRARHVTDGLSRTAAVAERLIQRAGSVAEIRASRKELQSYHLTESVRTLPQMLTASRLNPHTDLPHSAFQGRSWISGWTLTSPTYMHVFTPNTFNMHLHGGEVTGDNLVSPSSNHDGGVHVLMGDGHVRFVTDDIDQYVWWGMGSRNDGRVFDHP